MSDFSAASEPTVDPRAVPTYTVTLLTPNGVAQLDVPTYGGPMGAGRRAFWAAVSLGWGDVDEITVCEITRVTDSPTDSPTDSGTDSATDSPATD